MSSREIITWYDGKMTVSGISSIERIKKEVSQGKIAEDVRVKTLEAIDKGYKKLSAVLEQGGIFRSVNGEEFQSGLETPYALVDSEILSSVQQRGYGAYSIRNLRDYIGDNCPPKWGNNPSNSVSFVYPGIKDRFGYFVNHHGTPFFYVDTEENKATELVELLSKITRFQVPAFDQGIPVSANIFVRHVLCDMIKSR